MKVNVACNFFIEHRKWSREKSFAFWVLIRQYGYLAALAKKLLANFEERLDIYNNQFRWRKKKCHFVIRHIWQLTSICFRIYKAERCLSASVRCKARKCSEINQPGEPGGLRWDSAHVAAHVKICCINFGENQPKTRWEPGGNPGNPVCCGWDLVFDVAHVKLCLCSNFGGIWPLTRWKPGGPGSGPSLCCSPCKTIHVYQFWWNLASEPVETQWEPGGTRRTGSKPGLCCAPMSNYACVPILVEFGLWPGGNPEDRVRDPAYVVAHVKLYMCSNFGGIWPLNQWKPGGNPVGPGGPGQNLA